MAREEAVLQARDKVKQKVFPLQLQRQSVVSAEYKRAAAAARKYRVDRQIRCIGCKHREGKALRCDGERKEKEGGGGEEKL